MFLSGTTPPKSPKRAWAVVAVLLAAWALTQRV